MTDRSALETVLFTDIVGSTEHVARLGNRRWAELLERHHGQLRREIERCGGTEANAAGDAIVATFDRPGRAIRCAWQVRNSARQLGLEVRSGLHTGEVETMDDTVGGIAVHTGARVAARAAPGEILVSSTLHDIVAGLGFDFEDRGVHSLKGVPGEWRLFAVSNVPEEAPVPGRWLGVLPLPDRQLVLPLGALTLGLVVLLTVFVVRYNLDWPAVVVGALLAASIEMLAYMRLQRAPRRKQAMRTVGYAGGILTVGALGVGFASPSPAPDDILVLPFAGAGTEGDEEGVEAATWVANLLREQLAGSVFLRPVTSLRTSDLYRELDIAPTGPKNLAEADRLYRASGADYLALVQAVRPDSVSVELFRSVDEWRPLDALEVGRIDPAGVLDGVASSARWLKRETTFGGAFEREEDLEKRIGTGAAAFQEFLRGRQLYFFEDLQGARVALEAAVREDSTFALAHAWLARVYDRLFDPRATSEAEAARRFAAEAPPAHRDFIQANDLFLRKRYADLARVLPDLVSQNADDPEMLLQLGEIYRRLEDVDSSSRDFRDARLTIYTRLAELEPLNATVHKELALIRAARREWDLAEQELQSAVALNPYSADGYYNLGFLYRIRGRYDHALEAFQTADSLRPGYAADEIAFTLLELGRYSEAQRQLIVNLGRSGLDPVQVAWTHMSLGGLALEIGDTATAEAEMENAARIIGSAAGGDEFVRQTVLGEKARVAAAKGNAREVNRLLVQMEALPSETPPLFGTRARAAFLAGDSAAGFEHLRAAAEASTSNEKPTWLYELGEALRRAGRLVEAEQAYRQILALNDNWARAHYGLGLTLEAAGKEPEARVALRRFLELWSSADSTLAEKREASRIVEVAS